MYLSLQYLLDTTNLSFDKAFDVLVALNNNGIYLIDQYNKL